MTPEGKVKRMVSAELARLNATYPGRIYKFMPVQSGYGAATLDYLLCVAGRFVSIETKADVSKELTWRQQTTRSQMQAAGGLVLVICDKTSLDLAMLQIELLIRSNP